jgi:predicted ABC-type transport system involved in lysophospholipase L1 biosynthesis ATPase subunit
MNVLLQAENIHKSYTIGRHRLDVLTGAGLTVRPEETVAIVGKSGAGKSTLLHILGGLDRPAEGRVLIGGRDLYRMSGAARSRVRATQVGFVFQSYHLLPEMDVLENVMLAGMTDTGLFSSYARLQQRGMDLLGAVGLGDRAHHRPLELSGGEQQRVALARALFNEPQLVLADEPTGNLDEGTGGQVLEHLFALTKRAGHALVMVTHNRALADACDRSLRLDGGLIQ